MFTGIIQAVGEVAAATPLGGDLRLRVDTGTLPLDDVRIGDSMATNGVCLTVAALAGRGFEADVSRETLANTTLGDWRQGTRVNLEKALTLGTPLGGHLVSGHVDGVGEVLERREEARSVRLHILAPKGLGRYIAQKGSICVDGTSLTVNAVSGEGFSLNIVPHTLAGTGIGDYRPGTRVNLEVDLLARYIERLLQAGGPGKAAAGGVTLELLARRGFIRG